MRLALLLIGPPRARLFFRTSTHIHPPTHSPYRQPQAAAQPPAMRARAPCLRARAHALRWLLVCHRSPPSPAFTLHQHAHARTQTLATLPTLRGTGPLDPSRAAPVAQHECASLPTHPTHSPTPERQQPCPPEIAIPAGCAGALQLQTTAFTLRCRGYAGWRPAPCLTARAAPTDPRHAAGDLRASVQRRASPLPAERADCRRSTRFHVDPLQHPQQRPAACAAALQRACAPGTRP